MAINALFDADNVGKAKLSCCACGKSFMRYRSQTRGAVETFCSSACRNTGRYFPCRGCGARVYRKRYQISKIERGESHVWCSKKCKLEREVVICTCRTCGDEFRQARSTIIRDGRGSFCSRECKDSHGRVVVNCSWPGCDELMPARVHTRRSGNVSFKTELTRNGTYRRFPMCARHEEICRENLGDDFRPNGRLRWLSDPDHDLGSRTVNSKVTRLIVFFKTEGHCASCDAEKDFDDGAGWQIDHINPVYRGGKTNFHNLQMLCVPCHTEKTAAEKAEVARMRGKMGRRGRWMTHSQKDALISQLRDEIDALRGSLHSDASLGDENAEKD